jgi:hypothetical protein
MYLNVDNGLVNHKNDVTGRFGSGNSCGGLRPLYLFAIIKA